MKPMAEQALFWYCWRSKKHELDLSCAGAGVVAITIIGYYRFQQQLDAASVTGIGLIVAGVIVIQLFSGIK